MPVYSMDIREKIVSAYEGENTSVLKVAKRFMVSKGVGSLARRVDATISSLSQIPNYFNPLQTAECRFEGCPSSTIRWWC